MFYKIPTELARLNSLVLILLIFGVYLSITNINVLSPIINKCSIAMHKIVEEVRRFYIFSQINNTFNI